MTKGTALSSQAYDIMKNEIAGKEEQLVALHSAAARHGRAALADGDGGTTADSFAAVERKRREAAEREAARAAAELQRLAARFEQVLNGSRARSPLRMNFIGSP